MSEHANVGMDVHARSVACKALRPETGECWSSTFSGEGYEHELLAWLKGLPGPVRCAYESGCTGFWLCRFLGREGVECEVMAVSTLPRSPKNRRHKDDRHDAAVVLREMCATRPATSPTSGSPTPRSRARAIWPAPPTPCPGR